MKITKSEFGTTKTGSNINLFHLENTSGAYVEIIDFGCRLTKIVVPDRNGNPVDVCLGFSTADHYADDDASLGAVVGRVANRIKNGHFSLNGKGIPACSQQWNKPPAWRYHRLCFEGLGIQDQDDKLVLP